MLQMPLKVNASCILFDDTDPFLNQQRLLTSHERCSPFYLLNMASSKSSLVLDWLDLLASSSLVHG